MQILKYEYRLYPTMEQLIQLIQIAGNCRFVWNHYLAKEIAQYKINKKFNFRDKNCLDLTALKQATDTAWLSDSPATSLQQTLNNLDRALKQSFKKRNTAAKGFPKFKAKKNFERSFTLAMVTAKKNVTIDKFHVAKGLDVKCVYHREIPLHFKTCQIKQKGNKWFVVLTGTKTKIQLPKTNKEVGIDLNSKSYVLSNGITYAIPKYLKESQFKIKHLQQMLSKKQKGSNNRKKAQLKLYKVHQTVANRRLNYFNKLSMSLLHDYDHIILEDLNVAAIQKKFGHIIKDNGFGMFRKMIEYKAVLYGKKCTVIDRYFPSSQLCSQCGAVQKLSLDIRVYDCPHCDLVMDRDLNAAINIKRAGTAPIISSAGDNAFGDAQLVDQVIVLGILADINEEGSHVL